MHLTVFHSDARQNPESLLHKALFKFLLTAVALIISDFWLNMENSQPRKLVMLARQQSAVRRRWMFYLLREDINLVD